LVLGVCVIAAAATLAWYSTQTVRPSCDVVVFTGLYSPLHSPDSSERARADKELAERSYQEAIAAGRCDPPHARWHEWIG